jgi:cobalt-zinc-cadmium efflux system membrane fusion protein
MKRVITLFPCAMRNCITGTPHGQVGNPPLRVALLAGMLIGMPALAVEDMIKINAEQEQHIGIRTVKPEAISTIPLARAPARVTLPPQNEYVVSAAQAGLISRVEVSMGMNIAKSQVLAQIQSPSLLGLQRDVLDAVTGFNLAQSKLNRDTTLLEEGIIARMRYQETRSEYERYATALKEADQVLQAAGVSDIDIQTIKQTRRLNSFMNVRSPIDGVILERMVTAGQRVDVLAPLFRIGKLDELWLEIDMPQERMNEVRMGDRVRIENSSNAARITQIGQSVNPGSQSALVRGVIEGKTQSIRPGQNVNVQISHASTDRLFRLPIAALVYQEGKPYVFVRAQGGFAARQVAVASTEERNVVIHEGLHDGESVAVQGVAALKASWIGIGSDE